MTHLSKGLLDSCPFEETELINKVLYENYIFNDIFLYFTITDYHQLQLYIHTNYQIQNIIKISKKYKYDINQLSKKEQLILNAIYRSIQQGIFNNRYPQSTQSYAYWINKYITKADERITNNISLRQYFIHPLELYNHNWLKNFHNSLHNIDNFPIHYHDLKIYNGLETTDILYKDYNYQNFGNEYYLDTPGSGYHNVLFGNYIFDINLSNYKIYCINTSEDWRNLCEKYPLILNNKNCKDYPTIIPNWQIIKDSQDIDAIYVSPIASLLADGIIIKRDNLYSYLSHVYYSSLLWINKPNIKGYTLKVFDSWRESINKTFIEINECKIVKEN